MIIRLHVVYFYLFACDDVDDMPIHIFIIIKVEEMESIY